MSFNPNDPQWAGFVAAMRASPGDNTPRGAFADWFEEKYGDDRFPRFIRAQLRVNEFAPHFALRPNLQKLGPLFVLQGVTPTQILYAFHEGHQRYPLLTEMMVTLDATWKQWPFFKGLPAHVQAHWRFRRGWPAVVACSLGHWMKWYPTITAIGPVERLVITEDRPEVRVTEGRRYVHLAIADNWIRALARDDLACETTAERRIWDETEPMARIRAYTELGERALQKAFSPLVQDVEIREELAHPPIPGLSSPALHASPTDFLPP